MCCRLFNDARSPIPTLAILPRSQSQKAPLTTTTIRNEKSAKKERNYEQKDEKDEKEMKRNKLNETEWNGTANKIFI